MPTLDHASRRFPKATYTPLLLDSTTVGVHGRAIDKTYFIGQLALEPGDVASARRAMDRTELPESAWAVLRSFESQVPSDLPSPSALSDLNPDHLIAFGKAVLLHRRQAFDAASSQRSEPATRIATLARLQSRIALVTGAMKSFQDAVTASPLGMLHLERMEMAPAGMERGELLATIPLAPKEQTSVVQREWSVTSKEFTEIVTDSLENYSESGVTEKSELAQSTDSEVKHSSRLDLDASVSGSYGMVSFTAAAKSSVEQASQESEKQSRNHAIATTRKASSRTKKEHKITISTTSVVGKEETTTRTLVNPSDTDPMRIDYFGMMRRWHVRLYRYGLRLTYDIAIPEPGATLRAAYSTLRDLDADAQRSFEFKLDPNTIDSGNYLQKAADCGADVPPPPGGVIHQTIGGHVDGIDGDHKDRWHFTQVDFTVLDGYQVSSIWVDAMIGSVGSQRRFAIFGVPAFDPGFAPGTSPGDVGPHQVLTTDGNQPASDNSNVFMFGYTGHQTIGHFIQYADDAMVRFTITTTVTELRYKQWQMEVWTALRNATRDAFYAHQQVVAGQAAALRAQLEGVDTLTLRREENEEIMKGVLRWLLGPGFDFMPPEVVALFGTGTGTSFTGNELGLSAKGWSTMFRYQEMVKFINEAIEWENVLYFMFPYFWDVPTAWDFVRNLRHSDPTRQSFMRAGSARVVLTVRPGYEQAWTAFVEKGEFGKLLPPGHPYLTIAQEIQDFNNTNYPGIPPANPAGDDKPNDQGERGVLIAEWNEYTPTSGVDIAISSDMTTVV
jgi:hypothetical protein